MTTWSRRTDGAARDEPEYELLDTGIFNDDRYFDVFVEYAKDAPEDILIRITRQSWPGYGRRSICCRRCGFATSGQVDGRPPGTQSPRISVASGGHADGGA